MHKFRIQNTRPYHLISFLFLTSCGVLGKNDAAIESSSRVSPIHDPMTTSSLLGNLLNTLTFTANYEIKPPLRQHTGGVQTYASDLNVYGSIAVTSFNTVGVPQAGAVDVIDLSTRSIVSSKHFNDYDVNTSILLGNRLITGGAKEEIGAYYKTFNINNNVIGSLAFEGELSSYAATALSVESGDTNILASSGDTGGISRINLSNNTVTNILNENDARDVKTLPNGDYLVLAGRPGRLMRYNSNGGLIWQANIGGASIPESKSAMAIGNTYIAVSKGDGGLAVVCKSDGVIMDSAPQFSIFGTSDSLTVTNAVDFAPGVVVTASGIAGIGIYFLDSSFSGPSSQCPKISLNQVGRLHFGNGVSANNIRAGEFSLTIKTNILGIVTAKIYSGTLYIASGIDGFKAINLTYAPVSLLGIITL